MIFLVWVPNLLTEFRSWLGLERLNLVKQNIVFFNS